MVFDYPFLWLIGGWPSRLLIIKVGIAQPNQLASRVGMLTPASCIPALQRFYDVNLWCKSISQLYNQNKQSTYINIYQHKDVLIINKYWLLMVDDSKSKRLAVQLDCVAVLQRAKRRKLRLERSETRELIIPSDTSKSRRSGNALGGRRFWTCCVYGSWRYQGFPPELLNKLRCLSYGQ